MSGGGGQDDPRLRAQNQEIVDLGDERKPAGGGGGGGGGGLSPAPNGAVEPPPPPAAVDNPPSADKQRTETADAENKEKREPSSDPKALHGALKPTDVRVEDNGRVVRGRVGNQDAQLEITPTRTRLVVDNQPRGEFSTLALMDAAQRVQEGDTLRQARNNNLWGDLLKNPWFFVALALAVYAFTRRR